MHTDIVIAGAGAVGLSAALSLARKGLSVRIIEPRRAATWQREQHDLRVVAITQASQQLWRSCGVWDAMATRRISAYQHMEVWDGQGDGRITFSAQQALQSELGHIVELSVLESALHAALINCECVHFEHGVSVQTFSANPDKINYALSDGRHGSAALILAADGAQSPLRALAGIAVHECDYEHEALIAQIHCEHGHAQTAYQRFTEHGPLAFLPLTDVHQCSIVWSQPHEQTQKLLQLSESEFAQSLSAAFEHRLGKSSLNSPRLSFPLRKRHAQHYLADRMVLLGDAAHTMHPLAGQGLNVSLQDVAALTDVIGVAKQRGMDIGAHSSLRPFERQRRGENSAMLMAVGGFKTLFGSADMPAVLMRNLGMNWLDKSPEIKRLVIRKAMGLR